MMFQMQMCFCVLAINLLLTPSAAVAAVATAAAETAKQQQSLCSNQVAAEACRRYLGSRMLTKNTQCRHQVLDIICTIRSLHCPNSQQSLPSALVSSENPVCQQSCLSVFQVCPLKQMIFSNMSITEDVCDRLPNQLCREWYESSHCDDGSIGTNICQSTGHAASCGQVVVYIPDIVEKRVQRLGGGVGGGGLRKLRHPFKKSDYKKGNYTYAAEVNLAKVDWRRQTDGAPQNSSTGGGFERVLQLEIMQVLYNQGGRSRQTGYYHEVGSIQIVRLPAGCACLPVKLDQSLIFVGFNSYMENAHLTDGLRVILLPNNHHYLCMMKRCWNTARKSVGDRNVFGNSSHVVTTGSEGSGVVGGVDCECPCSKSELRHCRERRRLQEKRRGSGRAGRRRRDGTSLDNSDE